MYFFTFWVIISIYYLVVFRWVCLYGRVSSVVIGRHWSSLVVISCHWQSSVFRRTVSKDVAMDDGAGNRLRSQPVVNAGARTFLRTQQATKGKLQIDLSDKLSEIGLLLLANSMVMVHLKIFQKSLYHGHIHVNFIEENPRFPKLFFLFPYTS